MGDLINHVIEISDVNKDLDTILKLGVHDKLWIETVKDEMKNADGSMTPREIDRLVVHESANTWIGAGLRTYHGQGRESILAHIRNMVENLEAQTKYTDVLTGRPFIPLYANKIKEVADKIEAQILNQYSDHKDDIEDYVVRMRDAADSMRKVHESAQSAKTNSTVHGS